MRARNDRLARSTRARVMREERPRRGRGRLSSTLGLEMGILMI